MVNNLSERIRDKILNLGNPHTYDKGKYSVTELILCPFKPYYKRHPDTKDISREPNSLMINGTLMHEKLEEILKEFKTFPEFKNASFEHEVFYIADTAERGRVQITGMADAVTDDVWEFKYSSKSLPSAFQYKQANAYAVMLNKEKYHLLMINNFSLSVSIHEGNADKTMFGYMIENALDIEKSLDGEIIIQGPMYDWECRYCEFNKVCKYQKVS